ncbi:MAG: hypothetical protein MHPSP_004266, partial [Paramarteilia canceri]
MSISRNSFVHVYGAMGYLLGFLFLTSEIGNYQCHLLLSNLRKDGEKMRYIPKPAKDLMMTKLYNLVSCAHYTYEVMSWASYALFVNTVP